MCVCFFSDSSKFSRLRERERERCNVYTVTIYSYSIVKGMLMGGYVYTYGRSVSWGYCNT